MNKKILELLIASLLTTTVNAGTSISVDLNKDGTMDKCFVDEKADYPRIKCLINDNIVFDESYPDLTDIFDIEPSFKGFYINLNGRISTNQIEVFTKDGAWLVGDLTFTLYDKDIDSKSTKCQKRLNFSYKKYLDNQDNNALSEVDDNCVSSFDVQRKFSEIYDHLNPNTENGDYPSDPEYFSDRKRYIAYLTKYPLTKKNEAQYTQMALWLLKYGLYNESILLAANIQQLNPKSIDAVLILRDGYSYLQEVEKSNDYNEKAKKLAKELDIPLSKIKNPL